MISTFEGTVTTTIVNDTTNYDSYSTSVLSSLFASFLTGGGSLEMRYQKYLVLYNGNPKVLLEEYERDYNKFLSRSILARVPVRISSTSRDSEGNYYATFIGTLQSIAVTRNEVEEGHTLALVSGDKILAFTSFNDSVYRKLSTGARSRAEVMWKLQLKNTTVVEVENNE